MMGRVMSGWVKLLAFTAPLLVSCGGKETLPKEPTTPDGAGTAQTEAPSKSKPMPTVDEAKAEIASSLAAALKPGHKCADVVSPRTRVTLGIAAPTADEVKANMPAYVELARCAEDRDYFVLLREVSERMLAVDAVGGHPELMARALLGLGAPAEALKLLDDARKKNPKDSNVAVTTAKIACSVGAWESCAKAAAEAFKLSQAEKDPKEKDAVGNRAKKYTARAMLHLGKLEEAAKATDESEKLGGDKKDLDAIREALGPARESAVVLDVTVDREVELGTYHLLDKVVGIPSLVKVQATNLAPESRTFRVEASIEGVTEKGSETGTANANKATLVRVTPALSPGFSIGSVRTSRKTKVSLKVTAVGKDGEKVVYEQSIPITLEPRDELPLFRYLDADTVDKSRTSPFLGAWITPEAKGILAFVGSIQSKAPGGAFAGMAGATLPQVKVVYEALKARGATFVMDPELGSEASKSQRTRVPSDVLAASKGQALEATLLYATILEAMKLEPIVALVPGHAFVGWSASEKDASEEPMVFLETTMTHGEPFEAALEAGKKAFVLYSTNQALSLINVAKLRGFGVRPPPGE